MSMGITGYCIVCKTKIDYNKDFPFCMTCYEPFKNKSITFRIDGQFCHLCGEKRDRIDNFEPLCKYCKPFDRKNNSTNEIYFEKLNWYKNSNRINNIKPQWDTTDKDQIIRFPISNLIKIISEQSNLNTKEIFDNEPEHLKRIINILHLWEIGFCCKPPIIIKTDSIRIYDGQHRILSAFLTNNQIEIPIIIIKNS